MSGSSFGKLFKITTWGESHGKGVGVVIDGCPAGLSLSENDIQKFLDIRKPGQNEFTTLRNEDDKVEILSGTFEGKTTGTPISLIVYNKDHHSTDYGNIASCYRPGHADYTYDEKYGFRDYRGGGRSSGRETIGRVAAGAVAIKILNELGINFCTYVNSIGELSIDKNNFDKEEINKNPFYMPDALCASKASDYLKNIIKESDSVGSSVECIISGVPAGIGEPVFDKLDALLAQAVMSIGAVKAVEIGDGLSVTNRLGSENNDNFHMNNNNVEKTSNHSGGILGGISDGSDIILKASFKPTPSIFKEQQTVTSDKQDTTLSIKGRHDPIIGPRAVVVVESMCAITILDLMLQNTGTKLSNLKKIYN